MKSSLLAASLLFILLLSACSSTPAVNPVVATETVQPNAAAPVATTSADAGTVTAKLVDKQSNAPVDSQLVRLAKIYGEGTNAIFVYNENADPGAYTTADGTVTLINVTPGQYALILVDPNGNYSPVNENSEKIITVDVTTGQTADLGTILVDIAPQTVP